MNRPNFVSSVNPLWALSPDYSRCGPMSNTYHAVYFHNRCVASSTSGGDNGVLACRPGHFMDDWQLYNRKRCPTDLTQSVLLP